VRAAAAGPRRKPVVERAISGTISAKMVVPDGRVPIQTLAEAAAGVAGAGDLAAALEVLARATRAALDADVVVVRIAGGDDRLEAAGVAPAGSPLAAELAGTHVDVETALRGGVAEATRRAAGRLGAGALLAVPAQVDGRVVGSLEAIRAGLEFDADERRLAELAAAELALAVRSLGLDGRGAQPRRERLLGLAGDALAAGVDRWRASQQAVRIAVAASGARAGALWRLADGELQLAAAHGLADPGVAEGRALAAARLEERLPPAVVRVERLPPSVRRVAELPLGQPTFAMLQLFFADDESPGADDLAALASFAARLARTLREGERIDELGAELQRMRALLPAVREASARLSLAETLDTAIDRVAQLLPVGRLGVYLRDDDELHEAAGRALPSGHLRVATALLEAMLGPLRARSSVQANVGGTEPTLGRVRASLRATNERAAIAVPLLVREEAIGLLVAYPRLEPLTDGEASLLAALAAQLGVTVENARLLERAQRLAQDRSAALRSARESGRRLVALYEISNAFAESLSLERTIDAVGATIVDALGVDAAVIRVPDARGDNLVPRGVHTADEKTRAALSTLLERPQPARTRHGAQPESLDARAARRLGGAHALLVPFLERGATAALVPIDGKGELLAELTIVSLDPAAPIGEEALTTARSLAQQAALAVENARLHEQLSRFAETMRRSLLPQEPPVVAGLDVAYRYESAAQVEVGGDVIDFLDLGDGRLAVVLGDVTGHGIDAAAEMAMAKFVFRSLARRNTDPARFLSRANDVVVAEMAGGAFITMVFVTVDGAGRLASASAGHPRPRVVHADGSVDELQGSGLALGIAADQTYDEGSIVLAEGESVVLYTDGVIEARRGGELYGTTRLDAALAAGAALAAQALADAVIADCRAFAGGELDDDCAIVVIRRP
jgi:serine phosphatase RsbU (regulator of sigma subunit)